MLFKIILLTTTTINAMTTSRPGDEQRCFEPVSHYSDLGCSPVYSGKCPEKYDCPNLEKDIDHKKCFYKSKLYDLNDVISPYNTFSCPGNCTCEEDPNGGRAKFNCLLEECPPHNEIPLNFGEECIFQRKDCCSFKQICGEEELSAIKTCEWNNQTYKEGDMIRDYQTCINCRCGSENDESQVKMICSKRRCEEDIEFGHYPLEHCAPLYFDFDNCCPKKWICAEKDVQIVNKSKSDDSKPRCTFGKSILNIGDEIKTDDKCITCKCKIPPLLTCIHHTDCY